MACFAHARRKFEHSNDNDRERSEKALSLIGSLYDIEREARDNHLPYPEIKDLRQEKAIGILKEFEEWLLDQSPVVLPKSVIGIAINYTLSLWPRLKKYPEDGRFQIDKNLIENSIRPVALGRKNYLFAGSHDGASKAAIIYSLLETCKIRDVEPFAWLKNAL